MEFTEVLRRRKMVRRYEPDCPVPPDIRDGILAAAQRAPSAGFSQGWAFLVIEDAADRELFWSTTRDLEEDGTPDEWLSGMSEAPLLVVALSHKNAYLDRYAEPDKGWTDRDESHWPVPYWDVDTGMAGLLMLLKAVDEGLGACLFGIPPTHIPGFRAAFGVPEEFMPVCVISAGHPKASPKSPSLKRGHRAAADVVHHGRW